MKAIDLLNEQQEFLHKLELAGKSFNTIKNYRTDLNCFNKFFTQKGRDLKMTQLTATQVQEYCAHLEHIYNSPNSIRRRVQALRIFYDFLLEKGLVENNPIKKAIVAPKVVEIPTPPSFVEIQKLFNYFEKQSLAERPLDALLGLRNKILFYLIYGSGLKVSDIATLNLHHILKNNQDEYRVLISHPKRDPYSIKLPLGFSLAFHQYQEVLAAQKEKDNIDFSDLLFNANPYRILAGGLSPRGIEILFKDLKSKLKINITAKSLRQACIFKWLIQQEPQSSIKEWMGVQPQYSLKPYLDELEKNATTFTYIEIGEIL